MTHISLQKNPMVAGECSALCSCGRGLHPGVPLGLPTLCWLARMHHIFRDLPERLHSLHCRETDFKGSWEFLSLGLMVFEVQVLWDVAEWDALKVLKPVHDAQPTHHSLHPTHLRLLHFFSAIKTSAPCVSCLGRC